MIASLPMYARPHNRKAHDELWALIRDGLRARGIGAPESLNHDIGHIDSWAHPDLVLGQICNLPLRARFADRVTVIGAGDYAVEGCEAGYYRSVFITHRDNPAQSVTEMKDPRFVCNETLSQSGFGAVMIWAEQHGVKLTLAGKTGSHRNSIAAVADQRADLAAIDAQTWRMACVEDPQTKQIKVIGHSAPSPGMSFITRHGENPAPYFDAIAEAINALPQSSSKILGLKGIIALPKASYDLPIPQEVAVIPA